MKARMIALLNSFPTMPRKGITDWSGDFVTLPKDGGGLLDAYRGCSSGEKRAIEFCLNVWNTETDWTEYGYRRFNLAHAIGIWDDKHRAAFLAWCHDPFFP